jgi:hypothetical protein
MRRKIAYAIAGVMLAGLAMTALSALLGAVQPQPIPHSASRQIVPVEGASSGSSYRVIVADYHHERARMITAVWREVIR